MDLLPKRSSLVAQTVSIVRDSILAGVWKDFLPGEYELCERFQISRVTLRAALDELRREGWVASTQGRRRAILRERLPAQALVLSDRVVLLSPLALQGLPAAAIFWVDALRDHLAAAGYRLEFQASQSCYSHRPEHAVESLARRLRPAAWVLYLSTAPLQRWFSDRGLRCVVSGSVHPGVQLGSVDMDYAAACQHAMGLFAAKGHRRVAMLMPRSAHAGNLESERGFAEAGRIHRLISSRIVHHDGSVAGICSTLEDMLRHERPVSGILVAKPAHVVTTVSYLLRRGVRVPQDLSLISRDDDPMLEYLVPSVTRYHVDAGLFARKISRLVVDLVRSGVASQRDARLVPKLLRGETLDRCGAVHAA